MPNFAILDNPLYICLQPSLVSDIFFYSILNTFGKGKPTLLDNLIQIKIKFALPYRLDLYNEVRH